ncbi:sulfate adenylyltransferase [Nitratifractor salsuginis]|uniref:Sulfate adenylyltransferase n=1 Tax=Nitratifractor salsuginis (strain DSM 16511 / JCM 12458 / E9I37-1) TaxID=749222 RepID=E6X0Y3_NITSE|nr:sulfate adenylyltransferase [Nitratifractor salsuginis]ADV46915.1 sulfate adenylyltransferase [Nitratifractor salsuginis DSM 16511]
MTSSKRNKSLYIDTEALSTLALVQEGLLAPVTKLMGRREAEEVDRTRQYQGLPFPFSFILAPRGKRNETIIPTLEPGETVDLINEGKKVGELTVEEVFPIDPKERLIHIYGSADPTHPGVKNTMARLGEWAVSGPYRVEYPLIRDTVNRIRQMIRRTGAQKISAMMLAANPLNRAHERIIRQILTRADLVVLFLRKPFTDEGLRYDIRHNAVQLFIDNFLPRNKVLVVPFENTYIFAGYNELVLDALLARNAGCNELVIGKNHAGLGLYYDQNRLNTIFDTLSGLDLEITTVDEYVYCDTCRTLVSTETCPHGQHHHIHYHSESIMTLIQNGILPPPILVRKEISANILASLFPNRFENLQETYYSLMPSSGLLEPKSDEQFYVKLMELYQTSSLT